MFTSEIYLANKYIAKEDWSLLIDAISKYNGLLKKWKIIIVNDKNRIRYFICSSCSLPPTINKLNSFLLKRIGHVKKLRPNITLPFIETSRCAPLKICYHGRYRNLRLKHFCT